MYTIEQLKDLATKVKMIAEAQGETGFDYAVINEEGNVGYRWSGYSREDDSGTDYLTLEDINGVTGEVCAKYIKEREERDRRAQMERVEAEKRRKDEVEQRERQTLRELQRKYGNQ